MCPHGREGGPNESLHLQLIWEHATSKLGCPGRLRRPHSRDLLGSMEGQKGMSQVWQGGCPLHRLSLGSLGCLSQSQYSFSIKVQTRERAEDRQANWFSHTPLTTDLIDGVVVGTQSKQVSSAGRSPSYPSLPRWISQPACMHACQNCPAQRHGTHQGRKGLTKITEAWAGVREAGPAQAKRNCLLLWRQEAGHT